MGLNEGQQSHMHRNRRNLTLGSKNYKGTGNAKNQEGKSGGEEPEDRRRESVKGCECYEVNNSIKSERKNVEGASDRRGMSRDKKKTKK